MSTLSPVRWREISPHLDHALSPDEKQRAAWLDSFAAEKPGPGNLVRKLLQEHIAPADENFLETGRKSAAANRLTTLKNLRVNFVVILTTSLPRHSRRMQRSA